MCVCLRACVRVCMRVSVYVEYHDAKNVSKFGGDPIQFSKRF